MRVYLNVGFNDAANARRLGARWSPGHRRWYVEDIADLTPFMRWMSPAQLAPHKPRPAAGKTLASLDKQQRLRDREKRKQEAEIRRQRAQLGRMS